MDNFTEENKNNDVNDLVAPPIKTGNAESVLASLFRSIMIDLNITVFKFNDLLNQFIVDPSKATKGMEKDPSSAKGNIKRELLAEVISWKVFCKGIRFLNIWKFEIRIKAYHESGEVTEHYKIVQVSKPNKQNLKLPFEPN